jgi:hypothetical protein
MGSNWVEVAQQDDVPRGIRDCQITENVLDNQLGTAIRRNCFKRMFLINRNVLRVSIHSATGGEDHVLATVFFHHHAQVDGAQDIVIIICQRIFHTFVDILASCKMDDRVKLGGGEDLVELVFEAEVTVDEGKVVGLVFGQFFDSLDGFFK